MPAPYPNAHQASIFAELRMNNPQFEQRSTPLAGASAAFCSVDRVVLAGGQLSSYVTPESIVPVEMVYRTLPQDGIFTATPQAPLTFDLGSFRVPAEMSFVLLDYHFDIYRPSGTTPGDFVPVEDNRLSTNVGWDITSNGRRQGNVHYELNPLPPQLNAVSFPGSTVGTPATQAQFDAVKFQLAQSSAGDALSIMPQRHHRQGILNCPAPWIHKSGSNVTLTCRVMRGIPIPIAFFEAEMFGYLLPTMHMDAIGKASAPCILPPGGV